MKVCTRPDLAGLIAAPARSISPATALAKAHTVLSDTVSATVLTASKSPGLAAGKPASMMSTRIFSRPLAMRSFSSPVIDAPGLCSPSRKVVSKISKRFFMVPVLPMATPEIGPRVHGDNSTTTIRKTGCVCIRGVSAP